MTNFLFPKYSFDKNYTTARKAEFLASDLNSGGLLPESRDKTFLLGLKENSVLLNDIDIIPMASRKDDIHKINLSNGILKSTIQGANAERGRVQSADRTSPTTSKISLDTVLFRGEIPIEYSVLEDNIEKEGFLDLIHLAAGQSIKYDMENILINGNTGGATSTILDDIDGVLVRSVSNVYDAASQAISLHVLRGASKIVPDRFIQDEPNYKYYFNHSTVKDYGAFLAARQDAVGVEAVAGIHARNVAARYEDTLRGVSNLAATTGIFCNPKNIILGMHREVTVTSTNKPEESVVILSFSVRFDVNIKEEEGFVKIINIAT